MSSALDQRQDQQRARHKMRRRSLISLLVLLLCGSCFCLAYFLPPRSPDGAYYDPGFGRQSNTYLVFERGQYWKHTAQTNQLISSYSTRGHLLLFHNPGGHDEGYVFRASFLGLKTHDPSPRPEADRFLFRRGFSWIPKAWEWLRLQLPWAWCIR